MTFFSWISPTDDSRSLVELIVLNIGLHAEILSPRTFSMFVVHALILTFATTPLVLLFYPSRYRVHLRLDKKMAGDETAHASKSCSDEEYKSRFAIVLDKIEALPAAMTLAQLIEPPVSAPTFTTINSDEKTSDAMSSHSSSPMTIEVLRLMELTNRTSAVLRSQEAGTLIYNDPVVSVFRTFGQLNNFNVSANLSVVNFAEFPEAIANHVAATASQMVIIPWARGATSVLLEDESPGTGGQQVGARNPFDGVFHKTTVEDQTSSIVYSEFIRNVFAQSPSDIALFVDRGIATAPAGASPQYIFLPFLGGPDDRLALMFLVQLCERASVSASVVRIAKSDEPWAEHTNAMDGKEGSVPSSPGGLLPHAVSCTQLPHTFPFSQELFQQTMAAADTIYGHHNTQMRLNSDTADSLLWDSLVDPTSSRPANVAAALARIEFRTESSPAPLRRITELAKAEASASTARLASERTLIVFIGRSRRLAVEALGGELLALTAELGQTFSSSVPKTLGNVGAALVATNVKASLLVLQAAPSAR